MDRRGRVAKAWFMAGRVAELLYVFTGREVHDVLVRDDLRPGLRELLEITAALGRRMQNLIPGARSRRRRRAQAAAAQALRATRRKPAIIFVCQGNICRSPFAAALLRARVGDNSFNISSAGIMAQSGRKTPNLGVEAAAAYEIDLLTHRSRWLSRELAETASLLIVFDQATGSAVLDRYPDLKVPIILLGELAGLGDLPDPIDGGPVAFKQVYTEIAIAISELIMLIGLDPKRPDRSLMISETAIEGVEH
jgi:protein-tyrosine-phosphatase